MQRAGGLTAFDVCYFFRAVVEKFDEFGEEANCTVEDVKDEIFDMVKPMDRTLITLRDLENCKVGDTVVGMLTDMHAHARAHTRASTRTRAHPPPHTHSPMHVRDL